MNPKDFQKALDLIETLDPADQSRIGVGLNAEITLRDLPGEVLKAREKEDGARLLKLQREAEALQTEYPRWRSWLDGYHKEGPLTMRWHNDLRRYVGANNLDHVRGEIRYLLESHLDLLAECETCGRFFIQTYSRGGDRRQRFCARKCRDEYHGKLRKTPEGRAKRREYMRSQYLNRWSE